MKLLILTIVMLFSFNSLAESQKSLDCSRVDLSRIEIDLCVAQRLSKAKKQFELDVKNILEEVIPDYLDKDLDPLLKQLAEEAKSIVTSIKKSTSFGDTNCRVYAFGSFFGTIYNIEKNQCLTDFYKAMSKQVKRVETTLTSF